MLSNYDATLLIPFINKLAKSRFRYWGFLIAPIEIILMRSIPLITGREINAHISILMSISCLGWFTYFYLGYLAGNKLISIHFRSKRICLLWIISILLQIAEGFYYFTLGSENCGTQLKLTAMVSGVLFVMMAYNYVIHGKHQSKNVLEFLGDNSFGIYFSHIAVMSALRLIPAYNRYVSYPVTAVITLVLTTICVLLGKKILGKYSGYLAL